MKHKLLILLLLILTYGCQQTNQEQISPGAPETENTPETPENQPAELPERKLIRIGQVTFETTDIPSTRKTVLAAMEKYKGYLSSDEESTLPDRKSTTLVIRVPSGQFDPFLSEATIGIASFDRKEIQVKDVTEEFLDIEARLKTQKELEARLLTLLKQANTVSEILEIEKQVGELRAAIESVEGRMNYLKSQISYSTLTITFYERIKESSAFGRAFSEGFHNGWENVIWFLVFLVNLWPFLLIGLAILVGLRYFRRK